MADPELWQGEVQVHKFVWVPETMGLAGGVPAQWMSLIHSQDE